MLTGKPLSGAPPAQNQLHFAAGPAQTAPEPCLQPPQDLLGLLPSFAYGEVAIYERLAEN
jgi:hypothetical protein